MMVLALSLLPPMASCTSDGTPPSATTIRDSAGVRLVHTAGAGQGITTPRVIGDPLFRVGWEPGEPQFENITSGFVRRDGGVVVADAGANTLYALAPTGELVTTMGGRGEGPGEFSRIGSMVPLGADSFLVNDGGNNRVTFYDGVTYASDRRFEGFFSPAIYEPIGRAGDGSYWLGPSAWIVSLLQEAGEEWNDLPLMTTGDFTSVDTVASLPLFHRPADSNPILRQGRFVFSGGSIVHLTTDLPRATWFAPSGEITQVATWEATARDLTERDWEAYEEGLRERSVRVDPERLESLIRDRKRDFGGLEPLFRVARGDRLGGVWFSPYDVSESGAASLYSSRYIVISATGELLGDVTFPAKIRILDITEDRVLGLEVDEFDVQAVAVYQLDRR